MATITPVATVKDGRTHNLLWETMGIADTGASFEIPGAADKTVTVTGTFGSATVTLEGSNDDAIWFPLTDLQGADIALTVAGMKLIVENPRFIRPITSGGTGTDVDVIVLARSTIS